MVDGVVLRVIAAEEEEQSLDRYRSLAQAVVVLRFETAEAEGNEECAETDDPAG